MLQVRFQVRALTWVEGSIPGGAYMGGKPSLFCSHIDASLLLYKVNESVSSGDLFFLSVYRELIFCFSEEKMFLECEGEGLSEGKTGEKSADISSTCISNVSAELVLTPQLTRLLPAFWVTFASAVKKPWERWLFPHPV